MTTLIAMLALMVAQDAPAPPLSGDDAPLEEAILTPDPRSAALADVQRYLRETRSMSAHFVQRAEGGAEVSGRLSMARPGRIRFDYDGEVPLLIVADGETLTMIDTEIGQVTRWPVTDTPLRVLLGDAINLASYGASIELAPGGLDDVVALSASDPDKPEMGVITLYFIKARGSDDLQLASWSVIDAQDRLTTVQLSDIERNITLDTALWTYEDPRGLAKRRRRR